MRPNSQPADRPDQESRREDARRVEELRGLITLRKELRREVKCGERIDVEVVPLDQIAGRGADDRQNARAGIPHIVALTEDKLRVASPRYLKRCGVSS